MQVINSELIKDKKVLLRADLDVPIEEGVVVEDFRLKAILPTLLLCLEGAESVVMLGHIGRPAGKLVEELKVKPIIEWLETQANLRSHILSGKLVVMENLRFDWREEGMDESFANELASKGDIFINEAFAAYRPSVSTTILPKLLPHAAGLRFVQEVEKLTEVRENPKRPFIAMMGGVKVEDKLPVIKVLARKADAVLVGGKIAQEITILDAVVQHNVMVGRLTEDGFDISPDTTESWKPLIMRARMIVWNGPVGKFEDPKNDQSAKVARMVLESGAEIVVGGGDTISLLGGLGLLEKYQDQGFISTGGGAMLKFLAEGSLSTIDALD